MYELFKGKSSNRPITYPIAKNNIVRPALQREMTKILGYYRRQEAEVPRTHLIVRLIENLNISYKRDEWSIIGACMDNTLSVAQLLGLIHPANPNPESHSGVFYNKNTIEYIAVQDFTDIDIGWLRKNWLLVNTIHICTHPFSDIDYGLCNGEYPHIKQGTAGFIINVPALLMQYKYWCNDRIANNKGSLKPGIFVSQIVIPNMLSNHLDLCVINRAFEYYEGREPSRGRRIHPVAIADHTENVNECCRQMVETWEKGQVIPINDFFVQHESVLRANFKESFKIPDLPPTYNTRWFMELCVLKYVAFLVKFYYKRDKVKLRAISASIKKDIRSMESTKEYQRFLATYSSEYIREIKQHLNEDI